MPKNSTTGINSQEPTAQLVLRLLSILCQSVGHTFSWYISKKGRGWLAFKANQVPPYATSVEYTAASSEKESLDTLVLLMASHMRKVLEIEPPVTTWLGGKHSQEEYAAGWQSLQANAEDFTQALARQGMASQETIHALLKECGIEPGLHEA